MIDNVRGWSLYMANALMLVAVAHQRFGVAIWMWIVILVVVALLSLFTVSPAPPEGDESAGEPPP